MAYNLSARRDLEGSVSYFHKNSTHGASLSFSFNGANVGIHGIHRPIHGTYITSVHDRLKVGYRGNNILLSRFQQLLGSITELDRGSHGVTLIITESGSSLDFGHLVYKRATGLQGDPISSTTFDAASPTSTSSYSSSDFQGLSSNQRDARSLTYTTQNTVIIAVALAGAISVLGIIFLFVFYWKRNSYDSRPYHKPKHVEMFPTGSDIPIQDVERDAGLDETQEQPSSYHEVSAYAPHLETVSSRSLSEDSASPPNVIGSEPVSPASIGRQSSVPLSGYEQQHVVSEMSIIPNDFPCNRSSQSSCPSAKPKDSGMTPINDKQMPPVSMTPRQPTMRYIPPIRPPRPAEVLAIPF